MTKKTHVHPSDLRGLGRLTIDAIAGLTHLVEALHHNIARAPGILGTSTPGPTTGITGLVYRSIRGVTTLVGGTLDAILAQLVPMLGERGSSPGREAVLAALNGVLGDYLADSHNPLAIPMRLRREGRPLELETQALAAAIPQPTGKLLVLVHGLCMNDLQWTRQGSGQGRDQGAAVEEGALPSLLARDLGYTPVYLHYNSGRHVGVAQPARRLRTAQALAHTPSGASFPIPALRPSPTLSAVAERGPMYATVPTALDHATKLAVCLGVSIQGALMPSRRNRKIKSLVAKTAELGFAVPQVVAHRVTRMAMAGPSLSERDRKEFQRMGAEKTAAFSESWNAMTMQALRANQALAASFLRSFWSPLLRGRPPATAVAAQLHSAALGVLDKGMAPVHRKAVANAKRLARTKLR